MICSITEFVVEVLYITVVVCFMYVYFLTHVSKRRFEYAHCNCGCLIMIVELPCTSVYLQLCKYSMPYHSCCLFLFDPMKENIQHVSSLEGLKGSTLGPSYRRSNTRCTVYVLPSHFLALRVLAKDDPLRLLFGS